MAVSTAGTMTGVERIDRILRRKPVDRIGLYEHFWGDTLSRWREEGHIPPDVDLPTHFGFDMSECWAFNMVARLDVVPEVIEETEETVLTRESLPSRAGTSRSESPCR